MTLPTIAPAEARAMLDAGARLIDIREPDEFARAHVAGAQNHPIGQLAALPPGAPVIYTCRSGMRTGANAARLSASHAGPSYCLEGGLDSWRAAGLPVVEDRKAPLEIMRQVQITAGLLILASVALGLLVAPAWFGLAAFVGAGLTFAGVSGWCGMARLLGLMPWNRASAA